MQCKVADHKLDCGGCALCMPSEPGMTHIIDPAGLVPCMSIKTHTKGVDPKVKDNPKAALGLAKVPLHLVSPFGLAHEADAMGNGAEKYGAWNFRNVPISAQVYIAACKRHLDLWAMGQEKAEDSGVHHLGHAKACLGLILDSQSMGNLVDDRPINQEGVMISGYVLDLLYKSLEK
jgi:hypothetical protein